MIPITRKRLWDGCFLVSGCFWIRIFYLSILKLCKFISYLVHITSYRLYFGPRLRCILYTSISTRRISIKKLKEFLKLNTARIVRFLRYLIMMLTPTVVTGYTYSPFIWYTRFVLVMLICQYKWPFTSFRYRVSQKIDKPGSRNCNLIWMYIWNAEQAQRY